MGNAVLKYRKFYRLKLNGLVADVEISGQETSDSDSPVEIELSVGLDGVTFAFDEDDNDTFVIGGDYLPSPFDYDNLPHIKITMPKGTDLIVSDCNGNIEAKNIGDLSVVVQDCNLDISDIDGNIEIHAYDRARVRLANIVVNHSLDAVCTGGASLNIVTPRLDQVQVIANNATVVMVGNCQEHNLFANNRGLIVVTGCAGHGEANADDDSFIHLKASTKLKKNKK